MWEQWEGLSGISVPPFDSGIVVMWLRLKMLEGFAGDRLIELESDDLLKGGVFENLVEEHGVAASQKDDSLNFGKVPGWIMDKKLMVVRPITRADLEHVVEVEADVPVLRPVLPLSLIHI